MSENKKLNNLEKFAGSFGSGLLIGGTFIGGGGIYTNNKLMMYLGGTMVLGGVASLGLSSLRSYATRDNYSDKKEKTPREELK